MFGRKTNLAFGKPFLLSKIDVMSFFSEYIPST